MIPPDTTMLIAAAFLFALGLVGGSGWSVRQ
jgi:hypothetical protein